MSKAAIAHSGRGNDNLGWRVTQSENVIRFSRRIQATHMLSKCHQGPDCYIEAYNTKNDELSSG